MVHCAPVGSSTDECTFSKAGSALDERRFTPSVAGNVAPVKLGRARRNELRDTMATFKTAQPRVVTWRDDASKLDFGVCRLLHVPEYSCALPNLACPGSL